MIQGTWIKLNFSGRPCIHEWSYTTINIVYDMIWYDFSYPPETTLKGGRSKNSSSLMLSANSSKTYRKTFFFLLLDLKFLERCESGGGLYSLKWKVDRKISLGKVAGDGPRNLHTNFQAPFSTFLFFNSFSEPLRTIIVEEGFKNFRRKRCCK